MRTFVAVRPGDHILETIALFQEELQRVTDDVRWVRPESMHLTLQFLGDVPEREIPDITRALEGAFETQTPVDVVSRGAGVFPNLRRPRLLWAGMTGEGLPGLAERCEAALAPLGFPPAEREFRPHLTVGRFRNPRGVGAIAAAVRDASERSFGAGRIEKVILYRSDLRPDGAAYTPLATFPFRVVND